MPFHVRRNDPEVFGIYLTASPYSFDTTRRLKTDAVPGGAGSVHWRGKRKNFLGTRRRKLLARPSSPA